MRIESEKLKLLEIDDILIDNEKDFQHMLNRMTIDLSINNRVNVDFEGFKLYKNGQVCLGQFHVAQTSHV
jgi:hypothetical protein